MPETVQPELDDAAESELEVETDATEVSEESDDDEPEFFIPAPGGLRGL